MANKPFIRPYLWIFVRGVRQRGVGWPVMISKIVCVLPLEMLEKDRRPKKTSKPKGSLHEANPVFTVFSSVQKGLWENSSCTIYLSGAISHVSFRAAKRSRGNLAGRLLERILQESFSFLLFECMHIAHHCAQTQQKRSQISLSSFSIDI